MALVGNIRDFGLSDFLYLVDRGYKTGCLHLSHAGESASLFFDRGKLIAAYRDRDAEIKPTDLLLRKGRISQSQAETALDQFRNNGTESLSALLVDLNLTTAQELQTLIQQSIEEAVYGLFGWPEGEFRFEQNQKPERDSLLTITPIQVENLIMEGVRRIDEWGRIKERIPSTDLIVRFIEQPGERTKGINLSAEEWRVFARINGKLTLSEIGQRSNISDFDVCRIVYGFLIAGLVEVQRRPRPTAEERVAAEPPRLKRSLVARIIHRIRGM